MLKVYQKIRSFKMGNIIPTTIAERTKTQSRFDILNSLAKTNAIVNKTITIIACASSTPMANENKGIILSSVCPTNILK